MTASSLIPRDGDPAPAALERTAPLVDPSLPSAPDTDPDDARDAAAPVPDWVGAQRDAWGERLEVKEWEECQSTAGYRGANGWKGTDLVHSPSAPVRIFAYAATYGGGFGDSDDSVGKRLRRGGVGTTLTGVVQFTAAAESHRGYCHGGSMCSAMDDIIGWTGFLVTGRCLPWSGFTVQVNTSLKKAVPINSYLKISATIVRVERRKVFVEARLTDPGGCREEADCEGDVEEEKKKDTEQVVHATAEGLVVLNRGVLPEEA